MQGLPLGLGFKDMVWGSLVLALGFMDFGTSETAGIKEFTLRMLTFHAQGLAFVCALHMGCEWNSSLVAIKISSSHTNVLPRTGTAISIARM